MTVRYERHLWMWTFSGLKMSTHSTSLLVVVIREPVCHLQRSRCFRKKVIVVKFLVVVLDSSPPPTLILFEAKQSAWRRENLCSSLQVMLAVRIYAAASVVMLFLKSTTAEKKWQLQVLKSHKWSWSPHMTVNVFHLFCVLIFQEGNLLLQNIDDSAHDVPHSVHTGSSSRVCDKEPLSVSPIL